jgi:hypothetical protein
MCNIWWPTFGNAERSLFVFLCLFAQCLNTDLKAWVVADKCVHTDMA